MRNTGKLPYIGAKYREPLGRCYLSKLNLCVCVCMKRASAALLSQQAKPLAQPLAKPLAKALGNAVAKALGKHTSAYVLTYADAYARQGCS